MPTPIFICNVCKKEISITKCKSKDVYILSNVQRHILKSCWIKNNAPSENKSANQKPLHPFFQPKSSSSSEISSSKSNITSRMPTVEVGDKNDSFQLLYTPPPISKEFTGDTEVSFRIETSQSQSTETIKSEPQSTQATAIQQRQSTSTTNIQNDPQQPTSMGDNHDDQNQSTENAVIKSKNL